jgi:hypothetical protein
MQAFAWCVTDNSGSLLDAMRDFGEAFTAREHLTGQQIPKPRYVKARPAPTISATTLAARVGGDAHALPAASVPTLLRCGSSPSADPLAPGVAGQRSPRHHCQPTMGDTRQDNVVPGVIIRYAEHVDPNIGSSRSDNGSG